LYAEDQEQTIKKLEAELTARKAEIAALKENIDRSTASCQAQLEELEDLRVLALAVRKHFHNNLAVERCAACSKCDYEELEKAMLQCKAFTRIRLD
jgi:chromosome segregation ATPase